MAGKQINAQGEMALVAEWLGTLPASWPKATHIRVGEQLLVYRGVELTPAQARRYASWASWADARVVTPSEIWIVEGKLVATGCAYGQVLTYVNDYPFSLDYHDWPGRPVVPVVVCQAEQPRTAAYFATLGVRTIVFEPSFSLANSLQKLFSGSQILSLPPTG